MNGGEIIGLDPGSTTGWARFIDGRLADFGQLKMDEFYAWLIKQVPDVLVVENYRIRPGGFKGKQTTAWSTPKAIEVLGLVKMYCKANGFKLVLQEPSQRGPGYGYLKMPYDPNKKNVHHLDAVAHVAFYLVTKCEMSPQQLRDRQKDDF